MSAPKFLPPGSTIGVLGGGQRLETEQLQRPGIGQQNLGAGPLQQNADMQIFH